MTDDERVVQVWMAMITYQILAYSLVVLRAVDWLDERLRCDL